MTSIQITPAVIDFLYEKQTGGEFRCGSCGKLEIIDETFPECSRCGMVLYCSKECQKSHWKKHKPHCNATSNEDMKENIKVQRRIERFKNFYGPMIHCAVSVRYELYNIEMKRGDASFPRNHAILVHLLDLPDTTKKPRLCIGNIEVKLMSELGLNENADKLRSRYSRDDNMITFVFVYEFPKVVNSLTPCKIQGIDAIDVLWENRGKLTLINVTPYLGNPTEAFRRSKEETLANLMPVVQAINATAKGGRPDLYKAIKSKKSMREDISMKLSKLYPEFHSRRE